MSARAAAKAEGRVARASRKRGTGAERPTGPRPDSVEPGTLGDLDAFLGELRTTIREGGGPMTLIVKGGLESQTDVEARAQAARGRGAMVVIVSLAGGGDDAP